MNTNDRDNRRSMKNQSDALSEPDSETLHTTDPQEHMEGPVSSMMQEMKEGWETASEDQSTGQSKDRSIEEQADRTSGK